MSVYIGWVKLDAFSCVSTATDYISSNRFGRKTYGQLRDHYPWGNGGKIGRGCCLCDSKTTELMAVNSSYLGLSPDLPMQCGLTATKRTFL